MHYERLSYKRTENMGNYCSESLEATVILNEGDDIGVATSSIREFVENQLNVREPVALLIKKYLEAERDYSIMEVRLKEAQQEYDYLIKEMTSIRVAKNTQDIVEDIPY